MSDSRSKESLLHRFFPWMWYRHPVPWIVFLFLPLSLVFRWFAKRRKKNHRQGAQPFAVPVVVVGNISVGGVGKTPVIIALAQRLQAAGYRVGVISRGYGSAASAYPFSVLPTSSIMDAGDEPLLIAQSLAAPVVIDKNRVAAAKYLLEYYPDTQVLLSDDGLQHYRLHRDYEIVVIDGTRGLGNGYCLPAGPLRESPSRLQEADWILLNEELTDSETGKSKNSLLDTHFLKQNNNKTSIHLQASSWQKISCDSSVPKKIPITGHFPWSKVAAPTQKVKAVAAIGNPQRFFNTLNALGVNYEPIVFDDHHPFAADDFSEWANDIILMTSKDAVKCVPFSNENWWQLNVDVELPEILVESIVHSIKTRVKH